MKKYISLLLLLSLSFGLSYGQGQIEEHKPMGCLSYHFYKKKLERQRNDKRRIKAAERKLKRNYISANQVYKTLKYFESADYKLVYAKTAFDKLSDKSNALRICSALENQTHYDLLWDYIQKESVKYHVDPTDLNSYAEYLKLKDRKKDKQYDTQADYHDYSKENQMANNESESSSQTETDEEDDTDNTKGVETEVNDSDTVKSAKKEVFFPEFHNYAGQKNCKEPMSEKTFYAFANAIVKIPSDEEKSKIGIEYAQKYCMPTQYAMKISIFIKDQKLRYFYLKSVYEFIYDKENFHHAAQLLSDQKMKEKIAQLQ
jgi:hypothetical protein